MSTVPDIEQGCPGTSETPTQTDPIRDELCEKKKKKSRNVSFPDDGELVTQYFEPANPWQHVPSTTRAQLAAEYLESCRRHNTPPIDTVLQQIRELPENSIGGGNRAPRLSLAECTLSGSAAVDALEALLRRVQFRRIEVDHASIDDEGAEALFDMIEYYESAMVLCLSGPRQFGVRGWQAVSRMIKKSAELSELEISESGLEVSHAPVLARSLRQLTCRLRSLCLQRAALCGEPLLCLVIALKSNSSIRELRLGDNRLTASDAAQLGSLLRLNTTIHLLDLSNNQIQDAGAGHIADALVEQAAQTPPSVATSPISPHHCPLMGGHETRGLAFLVLWNNQLTRNCAQHLSRALRSSQSLCVLNVGRNALGGEAVRALAGAGALVSLGLQAARLGADAARALADLVRHDRTLQRLDLRDNRLGSSGLQAILNAMKENTTLTQIDLDDVTESPTRLALEDGEAAAVARLTRDIRRRVHRKISLTCNTTCLVRTPLCMEEERRSSRLRSPLPSPAGSPVPLQHSHSRFSVTRVTPDRESSTDSSRPSTPTRPPYCPAPSRFKVVQVIIGSELNLLDVKNNSESEACKHIGDASDSSIIKNTNSEQFKKEDASADQIIYQTFVGNQDISDKSNLIYLSVGDNSEVNISASVLDKDSKNVGSSTVDSKCTKMDSICEQKKTVGDDRDKNVVDSNKHDQYKDISKVLTHNETIDAGLIKSETQLVKNTIEITDDQKIDIEFKMTVKKENLDTNISTFNTVVKKEDPLKQIELITKDLSDLIDEMKVVTGDRDRKEGAKAKVIEVDKKINSNNEPEKHLEDLQVYERELERVEKTLISGCEVETDERKEERLKSSLEMSDLEIIRDIKETEQYVKYLRGNETILLRDRELENDGKSSVTHKTIESHTGAQTHVLETERHRKESVIERRYMDDHKKELDTERGKKEVKNKPARVKESVLKKNKSESSLDSSDMEVSRLMNKHINPFCDSSSSLEISGSSIESLTEPKLIITKDGIDSDLELDRRKKHTLSTGSSVESTDVTPMNTNLLNMSMSSNESVSPIFGKTKNIRDSLSSLEASVSSLESNRQDRVMVTSADSGIEHSLPKDIHESSSNEGTLTNPLNIKHDTLTASPKRASSLLDVPALKSKGLDRMRKISWVAPSSSFNVAKQDDKDVKPSHLEKLLSLFQHPSSIFSRSTEEEKKSCTPPKKDSLLTSSFWSWGSGERDKDDSSEATDSTLSERVQVSFIDESFSKKLDSKTPSTDTENTLSEFQTFIHSERDCENVDTCKVTLNTTDKSVVQIDLSLKCTEASNGNRKVSNSLDVVSLNKNFDNSDCNKNSENSPEITEHDLKKDEKPEMVRPRSFAAVLKASGSENSLEKQNSPEGQPVDKLPSKVIRGIKENISPENTLTSSMSNTKALALELSERQLKNQPVVNTVWELTNPLLDKGEEKSDLAPIATIEETGDESADLLQLDYIDDDKAGQKEVDVAKDALSYLMYENQTFDPAAKTGIETPGQSSLADELKEAEIKEMFDLSPELIIDEAIEVPEVFTAKDVKGIRTSPIIPERAKLKKSNSLEDLKTEMETNPKAKTIVFKVPESKPRDIPERSKLRSRSGSSPKSLPESLNKPCPLTKIDPISKKKKKVSSLGKMAKDSLLALNMSEEEIAEFRRSYKLTSVESLRSLESVSEDANSQSGNSLDSRCRACLRTSQESLMSLDSITEDVCRCNDGEKPGKSHR
ncbi:hypothetical protein K1T71_000737 [Dendrolimus kikuchii]|uniref:Uncharacterized protein n=1 Tax=Dendrolimus kikuchii TaxID=765133 RepID=A0ACC1DKL4_9NEOP|nr:hypothetical protein K1T71_000737 [Dendrolimus kikuchii]